MSGHIVGVGSVAFYHAHCEGLEESCERSLRQVAASSQKMSLSQD